jgi:hypothetical protein
MLAVLALAACRTTADGEKGAIVPVKLDERQLQRAYAPRRIALLVGISDFADDQWRPLKYARKDAADLARALQDPQRGKFDEVRVLAGPEQTTRAAVLDAVTSLRRAASRPDDVVIVYISAHGTLARDGSGELKRYLVTHDAEYRRVADTALPIDALKAAFDQLPSRRRLLVLATCHSGSGKSLLPEDIERELAGVKSGFYARPLEESSRASMVFSACDWGETAREDDGLHNDIYTHFFVEALDGEGDRNVDGAVTATEAHDYARRKTFAFTQGRQRPSAEILEVGADPIVLAGAVERMGRPELFSYGSKLDGFTLKVDGEERADLPGGAAVQPGKRHVELTKGAEPLLSEDVVLSTGDRLDLESLLSRTAPRHSLTLLGGGYGFVDQQSRSDVLPASPALGLSMRWDDVPLPRLSLLVDVEGSGGQQSLQPSPGNSVPFGYASFTAGTSAAYTLHWGRFALLAGPRVAALWLHRSFQLSAYQGAQDYFTVSPGIMGGVVFLLTERLELTAQANLMLTYVVVDRSGQALGFGGGWLGAGYRF